jgi:hypothetical protein
MAGMGCKAGMGGHGVTTMALSGVRHLLSIQRLLE